MGLLLAATLLLVVAVRRPVAAAAPDQSAWLIDLRATIQIFDCSGLNFVRIVWLRSSVDSRERVIRDTHNPAPLLRQRKLCGLTVLWGLHSSGLNHGTGGCFYHPEDGTTYRVSAELLSPDLLVARRYLGTPPFGRTKLVHRVLHGTSKGWCRAGEVRPRKAVARVDCRSALLPALQAHLFRGLTGSGFAVFSRNERCDAAVGVFGAFGFFGSRFPL